jgi:hypothetical protein
MFFGLSLRQFVFALLAVFAAVSGYFLLKPYLGTETVSWVCVLGAALFAATGFIRCNGITAERFVRAWLRSAVIAPKILALRAANIYTAFHIKLPFLELDYTASAKCRYRHFALFNGLSSSKKGTFDEKLYTTNPETNT